MIKKIKGRFYIYSHSGKKRIDKKAGFSTEGKAKRRLSQIEYFANRGKK